MPKSALFILMRSEGEDLYELYEHGHLLLQAQGVQWFEWLNDHRSFAFRGKNGHFNLLKESRKKNDEGYWYAYQRQGKRVAKRYIGRSVAVVPAHLEEIGKSFQEMHSPSPLLIPRLTSPHVSSSLFVQAIRAEAKLRSGEEAVRAVMLQASRWYEKEGQLPESIELALQAQEITYAATIIERYLTQLNIDDMQQFSTLRRWLERLSTNILSQYPLLCLYNAQALSLSVVPEQPASRTLAQMDELLQMAELAWQKEGNTARLGEVYAFRAYIALRRGTQEQACNYARQALTWLPMESQHWRGVCLNLLGAEEVSRGQLTQAKVLLQEALTIWLDLHHPHGARSTTLLLATVYFEQGALHLAAASYRQVVHEARAVGDREDLIPALIGLAQIVYEWNDLEAAELAAQEARDSSGQIGNLPWLVRSTCILAQIWSLQGHKALAQKQLATLLAQCISRPDLCAEVQLAQMHHWLADGDVKTVQLRLSMLNIPEENAHTLIRERKKILQLRVLLAQKKYRQTFEELEQMLKTAQKEERGRMSLKFQLVKVRLLLAEKQGDSALQTLSSALLFGCTEGYLRSFLEEGKEIVDLLRKVALPREEISLHRHYKAIFQAFRADQAAPRRSMEGIEPLSRQEQRVLRLIVAELSYPEIARELTVSVNTVKTQVNSIYRKLDVHSRREARAVVQDHHLFS